MSERTIQNGYLIAAQSDIEALRLRVKELESLVRAADRMREESTMLCYGLVPKESVMRSINSYDTQRAAVGEIEGD